MTSPCRAISRAVFSVLRSNPGRSFSANPLPRPSPSFSHRVPRELGALQSLLPLHSAVSSARLTSRLGIESCRMLSQGTLCSSNPGI